MNWTYLSVNPSRNNWLVPYLSYTLHSVCFLFLIQFLILDLHLLKDSCRKGWLSTNYSVRLVLVTEPKRADLLPECLKAPSGTLCITVCFQMRLVCKVDRLMARAQAWNGRGVDSLGVVNPSLVCTRTEPSCRLTFSTRSLTELESGGIQSESTATLRRRLVWGDFLGCLYWQLGHAVPTVGPCVLRSALGWCLSGPLFSDSLARGLGLHSEHVGQGLMLTALFLLSMRLDALGLLLHRFVEHPATYK